MDDYDLITCEVAEAFVRNNAVLTELVGLKDIKDRFGKTDGYLARQPLAWDAAKAALNEGE